jgi:hypothetical protein
MLALRELQAEFLKAILDPAPGAMTDSIYPGDLTAKERLEIYRNNVLTNLKDALRAVYPVIARLVGEDFFRYAARSYILRYPSRSGDLHEFGGEFPAFLADFPAVAQLPYLADVARLEWAWHEVFHAPDCPPLDLQRLAMVPPDQQEALRFSLHPAARLLASEFPVLSIWQVNQPDFAGDPTVDLDLGGEQVLIIRRPSGLEMERLEVGDYALLSALQAGKDLAGALAEALARQPDFALGVALERHVLAMTLVDFASPAIYRD